MKMTFDDLKIPLCINLVFMAISVIFGILNYTFNFILVFKILLITSLNLSILLRVKDSYVLLSKIKRLNNLDFPIYKDGSVILIGGVLFLITYAFLFLDCLGFISIFESIGSIDIKYKVYMASIFLVFISVVFFSNISGIIIRPYFKNGVKFFEVKEHTVIYGNELFNRTSGSFNNGIIIGYYIFYFKDIREKYKNNLGDIVITGFNTESFKIVISAEKSKSYFYKILNI